MSDFGPLFAGVDGVVSGAVVFVCIGVGAPGVLPAVVSHGSGSGRFEVYMNPWDW